MERNSGRMELKDCSYEALEVAVNFMYHLYIPDCFSENIELLHLADLLMMDDLKGYAAFRLAQSLSHANYLEQGCTLGCFIKDTLKENKNPNPVRNWGAPRKNISRRRG